MTTATVPTARRRSEFSLALGDCAVLVRRSVAHMTRNGDEVIQAFVLPVMLLLLFRFLFGGAITTGGPSYVNYVVAGVIVLSVAFNATSTAVGVATDLQHGLVERFRSMPMYGFAVLVGHVVSSMLRNILATVLVVGLGIAVGFRPDATVAEWVAAIAFLLLFMMSVAWIAVWFGVIASSVEAANGYAMILVFMPYASSALVPAESMPGWLRVYVDHQPFTPMIDTVRGLLIGMPVGNSAWFALAWWVPILAFASTMAVKSFHARAR